MIRKECYDRDKKDGKFKIGDYVILYQGPMQAKGKLKSKWKGPLRIKTIWNEGMNYTLIDKEGNEIKTNIHKIKKYQRREREHMDIIMNLNDEQSVKEFDDERGYLENEFGDQISDNQDEEDQELKEETITDEELTDGSPHKMSTDEENQELDDYRQMIEEADDDEVIEEMINDTQKIENEVESYNERLNSLDVNLGDMSHLQDTVVDDTYRDVWDKILQQQQQQRQQELIEDVEDRARDSVDHTMTQNQIPQQQPMSMWTLDNDNDEHKDPIQLQSVNQPQRAIQPQSVNHTQQVNQSQPLQLQQANNAQQLNQSNHNRMDTDLPETTSIIPRKRGIDQVATIQSNSMNIDGTTEEPLEPPNKKQKLIFLRNYFYY